MSKLIHPFISYQVLISKRSLLFLLAFIGACTLFGQTTPEIPPTKEQIRELELQYAAQKNNKSFPCPRPIDPTGCTNGDFESGSFDGSFLQGVTAKRNWIPYYYEELQCGEFPGSGSITDYNTRHTIVSAGSAEPLGLPLSVVPPVSGGNYALRLGNAWVGQSVEMVTKTFVVTAENAYYTFDYAVVLEDPQHDEQSQPTFRVRVFRQDINQYLPGLVSMGPNGQDFVVPNSSSFFGTSIYQGDIIRYSQWQCATIDLSSQIGRTVTLEFINEDCSLGNHFGYTYLDNLCGGCRLPGIPQLTLNEKNSSECGNGKWCFDWTAPSNVRTQITLRVNGANGQTLLTKQSPQSNGGNGNICLSLTFDEYNQLLQSGQTAVNIIAQATFTENGVQLPAQFAGKTNYQLKCPDYGIDPCCPPMTNSLLATLFTYEGTGNFSDPYRMKYTPTPFFIQGATNFFNYRKAIDPGINRMDYQFLLSSTSNGPGQGTSTPVGAGIIGVSQNGVTNVNIFNQLLSVNQWYRIESYIVFKGGQTRLPERCYRSTIDFRIQVSTSAKHRIPTLEMNIDGRTIRQELVGKSGKFQ